MPEPTAREALAAFAAELDSIADAEAGPDSFTGTATSRALKSAAALARGFAGPPPSVGTGSAQEIAAAAREPEPGSGEGETSQEPDGALRAAADAVLGMLDLDTWERWLEGRGEVRDLVSKMLAAAEPFIRTEEVRKHIKEQDAVRADLGKLLTALGLGDYARPQSPHEVMLQCIAEVERLRRDRIVSAVFACSSADCPRPFALHRQKDVTGVSGAGTVAHGAQFADGTVVIRWLGDHPSTVAWASLDDAMAVHGHDGKTRVVWVAADFSEMAKAEQEAAAAERARILAGAEALKHTTHGKAVGIVDWAELADLIQGEQP